MRPIAPAASVGTSTTVASLLQVKGQTVHSIPPSATVFEAIQQLARLNLGALVILQDGHLIGLFTERDYTRNVALRGRASKDTRVVDAMSDQLEIVTPRTTVAECMRTMTDRRVRHLPVVDDERLVGIISIGDLVSFVMNAQRETIEQLEGYIAGSYPR
jgi:CBS domain-containing protein